MYVQVKIGTHKIDLSSVTSKCGSKDNMQHTPRGGEKKVPVSAACHCVAGPKLPAGRGGGKPVAASFTAREHGCKMKGH